MKNQTKGLVSVLIVTYNRPILLKILLDSVIHQTYDNIEIIIVDDSTSTESEKLCQSYVNKIRYFHRQKKGGIPSAYNFGIKQMHGDWLKLLSDDNILTPNCIETLIENVNDPKYCILYSDYEFINDQGIEIGIHKEKNFSNYDDFAAEFWKSMPVNGETTLIHKSCLSKVGEFDSNFGSMSDFDWFLRACLIHKCNYVHTPQILLKFRLHTNQATHGDFQDNELLKKMRQKEDKVREKIRELIIKKDPQEWNRFKSYMNEQENFTTITNFYSKSNIRKIYKHLPSSLRLFIRRIWNKKVKSLHEFRCTVCKIQNKNSFFYGKPSTKYLACPNCGTLFSNNHLLTK